jgi:glycosyltransferase involved in cell wall biosynthesis
LRIIIFFTYGVSLKIWADSGLLQREIRIYNELMRKYNIQFYFLTYGGVEDRQWECELKGIKLLPVYERLPRLRYKWMSFFQTFLIPWFFRKEFKLVEILKTNQIWGGWVAVLVKLIFNKPLFVRCGFEAYKNSLAAENNDIAHVLLKYTSWVTYKNANHIWLNTNEISDFVRRNFSIPTSKITVRENWVDTGLFKPDRNIVQRKDRVLFVGRLSEEKNIPLLLNSLSGTNIGLDVVGTGILKEKIVTLAIKLNVDVKFLGLVDNNLMPNIYNQYQVYVLCSIYEGNPKSMLEAMACGCVVIGTKVAGIRNIINHNKTGVLVENSSDNLRKEILNLLSNDVFSEALSKGGRKRVVQFNSIASTLELESKIYLELIK